MVGISIALYATAKAVETNGEIHSSFLLTKKTATTVRTGITPQKIMLHQFMQSHSFVKLQFAESFSDVFACAKVMHFASLTVMYCSFVAKRCNDCLCYFKLCRRHIITTLSVS